MLVLQAWVHEMAGYLKEKDPNHLVTVGLEGFWGAHAEEAREFNPLPGENGQLSWTSLTGQNFTAQHNSPHIDFCGAHYWPDLWVCSHKTCALSQMLSGSNCSSFTCLDHEEEHAHTQTGWMRCNLLSSLLSCTFRARESDRSLTSHEHASKGGFLRCAKLT